MDKLLLICVLALSLVFIIIFHRWRYGVILVFIWLYAEDIVRRVIPGQPPHVMLIKDVLIFLTYISFSAVRVIRERKFWRPPFMVFFLVLASYCLIETQNPNSPGGILFDIIGLRSYFWYVPLLLMGYYMFKEWKDVGKFCRILVYTSIPLFALAVVQYIFYFHITNWLFQPFETGHLIHSFSGVAEGIKQIPSVFGNSSRYGRFSMLLFFLGLALLSCKPLSKKQKIILIVSTLCAFLGTAISGKRSPFFFSVIGFILIATRVGVLGLSIPLQNGVFKKVRQARGILLIIPIGFFSLLTFSDDLLLYYSDYFSATTERLLWLIGDFSASFSEAGLFGYGTGTLSQGLQYIPDGVDWCEHQYSIRGGQWFESGFAKISFELGIIGLFVFYAFLFSLFSTMRKELKRLSSPNLKVLGISIFTFSLCLITWFSFIHQQNMGDANSLTIFWFFNGVLFSLRRIEKEQGKVRSTE